ncbi:bifunctional hydroxymethylpyrimidine kinase/phosphomethylpyrimidine kinase [Sinirhodobacter populi]|uniref:hydroxymethylpyrimidine kinase n=1 Tax=Paenirhodobacter populi TaxID=2306993 RepID=A0A443JYT5_9RHOB|nr:bifunctional hydroxymethylpyrimidine kinase/phosphomethylpyrimidine kinase [Sinirhodobacter populi]RWR25682.1 bifunctional hydroxymethylpyrimidine kinase/phosphomethylpyrimidine kinase [Sinirhodobacter populi]
MTSIALTIAGSDSGGGAGIQADLKAFPALGIYGASVLTAVTGQNTHGVTAIAGLSRAFVAAQLAAVFDDLAIISVKIGMLGDPAVIQVVAEALRGSGLPIVSDAVMVVKPDDRLLAAESIDALRTDLLPLATVLTPNLPEAADLLRADPAVDDVAREAQGRALRDLGAEWVLMKGGDAGGSVYTDLLLGPETHRFSAPRKATRNTNGPDCTLSSAIAAGLAQGLSVPQAVARAHNYLQDAIAVGASLQVGSGHGPAHHFHEWWTP